MLGGRGWAVPGWGAEALKFDLMGTVCAFKCLQKHGLQNRLFLKNQGVGNYFLYKLSVFIAEIWTTQREKGL